MASVAVADLGEELPRVGVEDRGHLAVAAFGIGERAVEKGGHVRGREGLELEHERPRREGGVHEHGGVVRRRADQHDRAVLHVGQQHVLLRLVEAVDFVDEEDRAHAAELVARAVAHLADFGDVGDHARTAHEVAARGLGDHLGERGLAAAGRTEQDDVREAVRLDHAAEQLAGPEDVRLSGDLLERAGTHPRGKRL